MKDNMTFPPHRFVKNGADESPLIVLNQYQDDADETVREIANAANNPFNLLAIHGLDWNDDLTPWPMGPIGKGDVARKGLADAYLGKLEELIEIVKRENGLSPAWIGIAGYSLGGLFALYSGFKSNTFARIASCSGSLWYEGFLPYCESHKLSEKVDRIYLSLGDMESKSKKPYPSDGGRQYEKGLRHHKRPRKANHIGHEPRWAFLRRGETHGIGNRLPPRLTAK